MLGVRCFEVGLSAVGAREARPQEFFTYFKTKPVNSTKWPELMSGSVSFEWLSANAVWSLQSVFLDKQCLAPRDQVAYIAESFRRTRSTTLTDAAAQLCCSSWNGFNSQRDFFHALP